MSEGDATGFVIVGLFLLLMLPVVWAELWHDLLGGRQGVKASWACFRGRHEPRQTNDPYDEAASRCRRCWNPLSPSPTTKEPAREVPRYE